MALQIKKEFQKRWDQLKKSFYSRNGFQDLSADTIHLRKSKAENDLLYFAKTYFPDFFTCEYARFHRDWPKIALKENALQQVMAFRGAGKSTFFTLVSAAHAILYGRKKYLLFASYTETKSIDHTMRLLAELQFNQRIVTDFGDLKNGIKGELKQCELVYDTHTCMVRAVSIGQDPRGFIYGAHRPDFARLDDIQEDKRARKSKFVKDTCDWIFAKLLPAMGDGYSCIVLSTPLNECCVAMSLERGLHTPCVKTYRYPALKNGKSTWQEKASTEKLERMRETVGTLIFEQEYNLIPRRFEDAIFRIDDIKGGAYSTLPRMNTIVSWTDPSAKQNHSGNTSRDYKATVLVGVSEGQIYVLDARIRNESIQQMISGMYSLYKRWNPCIMYWEDNGGQALLQDIFIHEAEKRGLQLPLRAETNTINKEQRIEQTLSARIENGTVCLPSDYENKKDMALLVQQLVQHPDAEHDDGVDALEGAVRMAVQWLRRSMASLPRAGKARESSRLLGGFV